MQPTQEPSPNTPRATQRWSLLAPLAVIGLLPLLMIGADLLIASRVAERTAEIVGNTQRGIEIIDDLRAEAGRLVLAASPTGEVPLPTIKRLAEDVRAYDPLVTSPAEREEWSRLQEALARVQGSAKAGAVHLLADQKQTLWDSIDRLVAINREHSHQHRDAIATLHSRAILFDALIGALTVALVALIFVLALRVLAKERALTAERIALLDERNRDLDSFAGRVAHELRVPLSPIRGYVDLLLTGREPPEEVHAMASRIRVAVDRMVRIVDDMLELSRAGHPRAGTSSPAAVAAAVLEELGPDLRDATVTMDVTDEHVACADSVLAQILRNLVSNALKFRALDRRLTIGLASSVRPGFVDLVIEDNGQGIDAESARHAFEPHYRAEATSHVPGHGMGLAIVHRAAVALGGTCAIDGKLGQGTRITVTFPRSERPRQSAATGQIGRGGVTQHLLLGGRSETSDTTSGPRP